jgi:3-oxoacyl-[acyl-carrier protein] reductase
VAAHGRDKDVATTAGRHPGAGWRPSIDGNLLATFLTLKSFLPGVKPRGHGVIVTMASSASRQPDGRAPIPDPAA